MPDGENCASLTIPYDCVCSQSGQSMNVPDAYQCSEFNPVVDQKTHFRTRNLLCCPITDASGKYVAVIQVDQMWHSYLLFSPVSMRVPLRLFVQFACVWKGVVGEFQILHSSKHLALQRMATNSYQPGVRLVFCPCASSVSISGIRQIVAPVRAIYSQGTLQ